MGVGLGVSDGDFFPHPIPYEFHGGSLLALIIQTKKTTRDKTKVTRKELRIVKRKAHPAPSSPPEPAGHQYWKYSKTTQTGQSIFTPASPVLMFTPPLSQIVIELNIVVCLASLGKQRYIIGRHADDKYLPRLIHFCASF